MYPKENFDVIMLLWALGIVYQEIFPQIILCLNTGNRAPGIRLPEINLNQVFSLTSSRIAVCLDTCRDPLTIPPQNTLNHETDKIMISKKKKANKGSMQEGANEGRMEGT